MKWEDLSIDARQWMRDLGEFGPTVHAAKREVKGYGIDGKTYYTSEDLRGIAAACTEVADWLDRRAESEPHETGSGS